MWLSISELLKVNSISIVHILRKKYTNTSLNALIFSLGRRLCRNRCCIPKCDDHNAVFVSGWI